MPTILSRKPGGSGGGGAPSGPAGGDLSGTYPNPDLAAGSVGRSELATGIGVFDRIENQILAANGSFDFLTIPATYLHLRIFVIVRGIQAATSDNVHIRFNNDSGANYDYQALLADEATVSAAAAFAQSEGRVGTMAAANATANRAGVIEVTVFDYARTVFNKEYVANGTRPEGTGSGDNQVSRYGGVWRNTAAVSRITIIGGANVFVSGSMATLYGLG